MASPQSGTLCDIDAPETPLEALDADVADPGMAAEAKEAKATEEEQSAAESDENNELIEDHWIGIELKDDEGNPIPNESFKLKLPDGNIINGRLDKEGKAKIEGLSEGGDCEVSFPRIHGDEWSSL